jgi:alkylation response protein AidB-like acyl-CoA dehydrogenase
MSTDQLALLLERVDKIEQTVRDGAVESEARGNLTPAVFGALRDAELFRMLVPEEYGGHALTIPESIDVVERVASFDASTGWNLAILGGAPMLARLLGPAARDEILGDPDGLIAGSLNPAVTRAERVDGGYVYSGRATYLSGSAHAKWIMANALVTENGEPVMTERGPELRAGFFPITRARCLDTWHVTGMRGTGSNDWEFEGVEVGEDWTFMPLQPRVSVADGSPVGNIPLWSQLGSGLAACVIGAARNMCDRFLELAATKVPVGNFVRLADKPQAQIAFAEATGLCHAAHVTLRDTVADIWARGIAGAPFDPETLAHQRLGSVTSVRLAARAVDLLFDVSGMTGVATGSELDRCWRDVHTMTQHVILSTPRFETAGRVLFGLDPGAPII